MDVWKLKSTLENFSSVNQNLMSIVLYGTITVFDKVLFPANLKINV